MIPESRTNGWKQSWKKFHFEHLYIKGQYLVYPNFKEQHSLSTNHMEFGEHITARNVHEFDITSFSVPLLRGHNKISRLQLPDMSELPVFDLFGEPWLTKGELRRTLLQMASDVQGIDMRFIKRKKHKTS